MKKILTVSIAAYNVSGVLKTTLDSLLLDKNYAAKLEVLIVNDGSTDSTRMIAKEYEKKYSNVFKVIDKENGGYGSTINMAIKHASGKYFKQLDGDDWYLKENLPAFLEFLDKCEADLVLSPFYEVYEPHLNYVLVDHHTQILQEGQNIKQLLYTDDVLMHELTITTELLRNKKIEISEHCFYTDNEYTFLPLCKAEKIARFPHPVYCYRLGKEGQSVSLSGIRRHYKDTIIVAQKIYSAYMEYRKDNLDSNLTKLLEKKVFKITDIAYSAYMLLEHPMNFRNELKKFDRDVKEEYPYIYKQTMKIKKVVLVRFLPNCFYGFICMNVLKRFHD